MTLLRQAESTVLRTLVLALVALVLGALPRAVLAGERLVGPLPAEVISVIDGDTLEVRVHIWLGQDISTRVRLAGIDAPELKGKCDREKDLARRARAYLVTQLGSSGSGAGSGAESGPGSPSPLFWDRPLAKPPSSSMRI